VKKNGVAISGGDLDELHPLHLPTMADNGAQFTVTVSNSMSTATSSAAVLKVNSVTLDAAYGLNEEVEARQRRFPAWNTAVTRRRVLDRGHNGSALSLTEPVATSKLPIRNL